MVLKIRLAAKRCSAFKMKSTVVTLTMAVACASLALFPRASHGRNVTAAQIVTENVAARGGMEAWRKVQTMVWLGHIESDHAPLPSMAFVLEQKRPNKTHFVVHVMRETTQRGFDGSQGWKTGSQGGGRAGAQPYSLQELRFAQSAPGLDGPLIDSAAKGSTVTLEGLDEIEGRKAYRLGVRLAAGEMDHVWIDAQTMLEIRFDRPSDGVVGATRAVTLLYRDYKTFNGLLLPSIIETVSGAGHTPDRMVIERVVVNSPLNDARFAKPGTASGARKLLTPQTPGASGIGSHQDAGSPPQ